VSEFSRQWLKLREPADHRARSSLNKALSSVAGAAWHVVDLGCGTGSNYRYLSDKLGGAQQWLCLDHDAALLETLAEQSRIPPEIALQTKRVDLARNISAVLEEAIKDAATNARVLVTASALLDLVSESWLDAMIDGCARDRAVALFALTFDGRMELTPSHAEDDNVRWLIETHQHKDKGFGPALGPDATRRAHQALERYGYDITETTSDWVLGPADGRLQRELLEGWFAAAVELAGESMRLREWHAQRAALIAAEQLTIRVGHRDLLAKPSETA
jgi:hypothetical protein